MGKASQLRKTEGDGEGVREDGAPANCFGQVLSKEPLQVKLEGDDVLIGRGGSGGGGGGVLHADHLDSRAEVEGDQPDSEDHEEQCEHLNPREAAVADDAG